MIVIMGDLWLCDDCTIAAVNGDYSGVDYSLSGEAADRRIAQIVAGLVALGPNLVPDDGDDSEDTDPDERRESGRLEFSWRRCDCCHARNNAGSRTRFAILGSE